MKKLMPTQKSRYSDGGRMKGDPDAVLKNQVKQVNAVPHGNSGKGVKDRLKKRSK